MLVLWTMSELVVVVRYDTVGIASMVQERPAALCQVPGAGT